MVSQSDWIGSWPLLVPQKIKMTPTWAPTATLWTPKTFKTQHVQNRHRNAKLYYNSNDILLDLILNKAYVRGLCVLASIKNGLRFYVKFEMDKKASWRPQEAEKVPTETFLDDFEPQVETKRGPRSTPNRSKTQKNERYHLQNTVFPLLVSLAGATGQLS